MSIEEITLNPEGQSHAQDPETCKFLGQLCVVAHCNLSILDDGQYRSGICELKDTGLDSL